MSFSSPANNHNLLLKMLEVMEPAEKVAYIQAHLKEQAQLEKLFNAKMALVSKGASDFVKDAYNEHGKYGYISTDQVLDRVGALMAEQAIMVYPMMDTVESIVEPVDKLGQGQRMSATLIFDFLITDGEYRMIVPWKIHGADHSHRDKAFNKAITVAHKYLLMKLFNVAVGNSDGEHDPREPQQQKQQQQQPPKKVDTTATIDQLITLGRECYGDEWAAKSAEMQQALKVEKWENATPEQLKRVIDGINKRIAHNKRHVTARGKLNRMRKQLTAQIVVDVINEYDLAHWQSDQTDNLLQYSGNTLHEKLEKKQALDLYDWLISDEAIDVVDNEL